MLVTKRILYLGAIFIIALIVLSSIPATAIQASSKVVFIGGYDMAFTGGSPLPISGGAFSSYTFSTLMPGSVTATNLVGKDTAVLNMASYGTSPSYNGLRCDSGRLSGSEKDVINNFVANGGKLIIYDVECSVGVNYDWLTYPFHTSNPGATGSRSGTLTIYEENELSRTNPADPKYINTAAITTDTDAVGDMNVADTLNINPNWCLDMTGRNVRGNFGATHMYAKSGSGLFIYNGLDTNYNTYGTTGATHLNKIWLQELQASGADLPCGISPGGISLNPHTVTNPVGTSHTVTALVTIAGTGIPISGKVVTFEVVSGPNTGVLGTVTTDASGLASKTYSDNGGAGTDKIKASFIDDTGATRTSNIVEKIWEPTCTGSTCIPEFPTVALPIMSVLGIMFLMSRKKHN